MLFVIISKVIELLLFILVFSLSFLNSLLRSLHTTQFVIFLFLSLAFCLLLQNLFDLLPTHPIISTYRLWTITLFLRFSVILSLIIFYFYFSSSFSFSLPTLLFRPCHLPDRLVVSQFIIVLFSSSISYSKPFCLPSVTIWFLLSLNAWIVRLLPLHLRPSYYRLRMGSWWRLVRIFFFRVFRVWIPLWLFWYFHGHLWWLSGRRVWFCVIFPLWVIF